MSDEVVMVPEDLKELYESAKGFSQLDNWMGHLSMRVMELIERIAQQDAEIERLNLDNIALLNSAGVWRNRAINDEEELAGTNRLRKSRKRTDQQLQPKGEQG